MPPLSAWLPHPWAAAEGHGGASGTPPPTTRPLSLAFSQVPRYNNSRAVFPAREFQTVEKGVLTPWPPLRGGSARRRWGRELYGCPKYFGLWQGSLPPPLRGTSLAEGGFSTRCTFPRWGRLFVFYGFSSGSATGTPRCSTGVEKTICVRVRPNCCRWLMN